MCDVALVYYSEIAIKGGKRPFFEKKLIENIERSVEKNDRDSVKKLEARLVIKLKSGFDINRVKNSLQRIFGIKWFAFAYLVPPEIEEIKRIALDKIKNKVEYSPNFRVVTRRADKDFPLTSQSVNEEIGEAIVRNYNLKVDLDKPQLEVHIEILRKQAFLFFHRVEGLGGLPVSTSGRVLALLSGGIDSPAAAWLMMKRGSSVDFLHFHPYRSAKEVENSKIFSLVRLLTQYSFKSKLYLVPFYPFHVRVVTRVDQSYEMVLFRRYILRVAEEVARREGIKGIVTGDNLAQVASQTLDNIYAVEREISIPIFRPLISYDKDEIVDIARKVGSYEISISPYYKDCCSILARHPKTEAKTEVLEKLAGKIDMEGAVSESLLALECFRITNNSRIN